MSQDVESRVPKTLEAWRFVQQMLSDVTNTVRADAENEERGAQYRLPGYYRWLRYAADHRQAYRYHRIFLQHLQSGMPGQWLLKSPAHLWRLDALVAEYPDALIVQTHRDPLNVISSISALTHHVRRLA
jgi:hypothetical protein